MSKTDKNGLSRNHDFENNKTPNTQSRTEHDPEIQKTSPSLNNKNKNKGNLYFL